jgi:3'(2'), 5'-bisphosphate nucleotidase
MIVEEAGGKVTDILGQPVDFSSGVTMERNRGILVTNGILHDLILKVMSTISLPAGG